MRKTGNGEDIAYSQVHFCSTQNTHTQLCYTVNTRWTSQGAAVCVCVCVPIKCPYDNFPVYETFILVMH